MTEPSRHRVTICDQCGGEMWAPTHDKPRPWLCFTCRTERNMTKYSTILGRLHD